MTKRVRVKLIFCNTLEVLIMCELLAKSIIIAIINYLIPVNEGVQAVDTQTVVRCVMIYMLVLANYYFIYPLCAKFIPQTTQGGSL